jgi:5-(carboxyamino)imidazole ribonucleotide synthase
MNKSVSPFEPGHLGIAGAGQLAKMTALAAYNLGCRVSVLERNDFSPAVALAGQSEVGDWNDPQALMHLAEKVDVLTLESEFVDAGSLAEVERAGHTVLPSSNSMALIQDKLVQKQTLKDAGLPVPRFCAVEKVEDVEAAAAQWGWPLVLKTRRDGYDGKGNAAIDSAAEIEAAWERLGGKGLFVEEFCDFKAELAIIVTRGRDGEAVNYPLVESVQRNHVCHLVRAPAPVQTQTQDRAIEVARLALDAVGGVGSFGVEMFLASNGEITINELAPRVHNTGHYTIEACVCSQFENHVRAVMGWPLGSTAMRQPAAVMVNLLGVGPGSGRPQGFEQAMAVAGAHIHIYGKTISGKGRKMGHVTALGATIAEAEHGATQAADLITFGEQE